MTHSSYFSHANGAPLVQDTEAVKENIPINHDPDQSSLQEGSVGAAGTAGRGKVLEPTNFERDSLEKFPMMKKYFEENPENKQASSDSKATRSKAIQKKFDKKMNSMINQSYTDQTGELAYSNNNTGTNDSPANGKPDDRNPFSNRERPDDFSKKFATSSFEGAANRKKVKMEQQK